MRGVTVLCYGCRRAVLPCFTMVADERSYLALLWLPTSGLTVLCYGCRRVVLPFMLLLRLPTSGLIVHAFASVADERSYRSCFCFGCRRAVLSFMLCFVFVLASAVLRAAVPTRVLSVGSIESEIRIPALSDYLSFVAMYGIVSRATKEYRICQWCRILCRMCQWCGMCQWNGHDRTNSKECLYTHI